MITISRTIKKVACAVLTAALVVTGVVGPQKVNAANYVNINVRMQEGSNLLVGEPHNIAGTISVVNARSTWLRNIEIQLCNNSGTVLQRASFDANGSTSVNVINTVLNTRIRFASLAVGSYHLNVVVDYYTNMGGVIGHGRVSGRVDFRIVPRPANRYTDFVTKLYKNILYRDPDPQGLANWVNALNNGATGSEIARGFLTSAEFTNKNVSDESFVSTLYNALLDRAPDQQGYDGWVAALKNGNSRINVLNSFMGSQEFKDVCARYNVRP